MRTRVITAIVALAIFIPLLVYGRWPLSVAMIVLGIVAMGEVLAMKKILLISLEGILSFIGVTCVIIPQSWLTWLPSNQTRIFAVYIIIALMLLLTVFFHKTFSFDDAGVLVLAMLYIGFGFNFFLQARADSLATLLYGVITVWITDSGAYMVGRKVGKHKLAPYVSPNKTWEGSVGGTLAAIIIMAVYLHFFAVGYHSYALMVLATLVLSVVGQLGDLVESALKRFYGVKDSGKALPGHGGILDRFDSMLLVMPMMHLLGII